MGLTLWWGGEVVGGWAVRLAGTVVVPSFRIPLERRLSAG